MRHLSLGEPGAVRWPVDPVTKTAAFDGSGPTKGSIQSSAGDGALYCMPLKAHYVMKIVPSDEKAVARVRRARHVALALLGACSLVSLYRARG